MFLISAIVRARRVSKATGKDICVLHDGKTWQACDECEMDTNYPETMPVVYVAQGKLSWMR